MGKLIMRIMSETHGRQTDRKDGGESEVPGGAGVGHVVVAVALMLVAGEEEMAEEKSIDSKINESFAVSLHLESEHPIQRSSFPPPHQFFPKKEYDADHVHETLFFAGVDSVTSAILLMK